MLSRCTFDLSFAYFQKQKLHRKVLIARKERIELENVPSPENRNKYRSVTVEVIRIEQALTVTMYTDMKLQSEYDIIYVNKQFMFGNDDISNDVDATILLGEFMLKNVQLPPKMLLCRLSSMLSNNKYIASEKEDMAKNIYKSLRSIPGKRDYELYRFCCSLGPVSAVSNIDLLHVLRDHEATLPCKVWVSIIMKDNDKYWIAYVKCNPSKNVSKYACPKYSPPRDGGSFEMPTICLYKHPVLADFQYVEMLSIIILDCLNKHRERILLPLVARGPIHHEMMTIHTALEVYKSSSEENWMHNFVAEFTRLHTFSMVAYNTQLVCMMII